MATESFKSSHRQIISLIHRRWFDGTPFAIWEVRDATGCSTSTVIRVLRQLVKLRWITHMKKGYAGRHYRVNRAWPFNLKEAIQAYEYAKILKL